MTITDYIINKIKDVAGENSPILIGVCGRAGAGKTTLTKKISAELKKQKIDNLIYSGDWRFSLDSKKRKLWLQEKWKAGIDAYLYAINQFSWWNFEQIYKDLKQLSEGKQIEIIDAYNRATGKKDLHVKLYGITKGVIFFENSILGGIESLPQVSIIILVSTPDLICFKRILKKDANRRSLPEIMSRYLITTYSENTFFRLLFDNFKNKIVVCNSNGNFSPYPKIENISHIPVPIINRNYIERKKGVIFCDLDGTLIKHVAVPSESGEEIELIDGSVEKLMEFSAQGYYLILTTSRPQNKVFGIIEKLRQIGLEFDQIVCDLPVGPRHLINDSKDGEVRAFAYALKRDEGIKNLHLP